MRRRRNIGCGRSGPLGLRRPDSDELVGPILVRPPIRAIRRWINPHGRIVPGFGLNFTSETGMKEFD